MKLIELGREPLPQFYEQPEISERLAIYWGAFADLGTERQIGMAIGPIPRSKLRAYASEELGLVGEAHDQFCAVISAVDADYVGRINAVKDPRDDMPMRSIAKPEDGKSVGRILKNVAKNPAKLARQKARPLSDG